MDDADLVRVLKRARAGERKAFAELYRAFSPRVFGLCRRLLGSVDRAEEATQESFLRAQRGMNGYHDSLPFPRWLLGIAGNLCVDRLRRRAVERRIFREEAIEESEAARAGPPPLAAVMEREERGALRRAVEDLPERYRIPLVMRYYGEQEDEEIAGSIGVTRAHVATLLFRARQELRKKLLPSQEEGKP